MERIWMLLAILVACAGCGAPDAPFARRPPEPLDAGSDAGNGLVVDRVDVVGGVPARGRDPSVLAIDAAGEAVCTGALISPRLVLTARRCASKLHEPAACPASSDAEARDPATLAVLLGDDVASGRLVAHGVTVITPPSATACESDIALLVVDRPITFAKPLLVRPRGPARGERIRAVSFAPREVEPNLVKLVREHVRVVDVGPAEFRVAEAACRGDVGGVAVDEDTGEILGVLSRSESCEGPGARNVYTRADTFARLVEEAFLRVSQIEYDEAVDAGADDPTLRPVRRGTRQKPASDVGGPCERGAECSAGACVLETERRYCSRSCEAGDRCPTRYHCTPVEGRGLGGSVVGPVVAPNVVPNAVPNLVPVCVLAP